MNAHTQYFNWADEDLLREIDNQNPLLTTEFEKELARRLAEKIDEAQTPSLELLNDNDITSEAEVQTLLDTAADVKKLLEDHDQFDDLDDVNKYLTKVAAAVDELHEIDDDDLAPFYARIRADLTLNP